METYFLLRDNRESGPYTAKELKAKGLYPSDLIWVDGESTYWKHPADFSELNEFVKEPERKPAIVRQIHSVGAQNVVNTTEREATQPIVVSASDAKPFLRNEMYYDPSIEEIKFSFAENTPRKKAWRQSLNLGANLIGLVTLVMGVMLCAVMVKKAVDNIDSEPEEATADAREIVTGNLSEDVSKHAALSTTSLAQNNLAIINAISKEEIKNDSVATLRKDVPVKKEAVTKKPVLVKSEPEQPVSTTIEDPNADLIRNKEAEEKQAAHDAAEKAAAKASLQVSANDYKVGLFGGISHLALTVNNPSSQPLENIAVEVEYLKPNGKVVGTKTVDAGSLAPGASKTIDVPDNGRGVNVRYHIVDK